VELELEDVVFLEAEVRIMLHLVQCPAKKIVKMKMRRMRMKVKKMKVKEMKMMMSDILPNLREVVELEVEDVVVLEVEAEVRAMLGLVQNPVKKTVRMTVEKILLVTAKK